MASLIIYLQAKELGVAYSEGAFVTTDPHDPNWVKGSRTPDLMYFEANRFKVYKEKIRTGEMFPSPLCRVGW